MKTQVDQLIVGELSEIQWLGGGNSNIFGIFTPKLGEDFHQF